MKNNRHTFVKRAASFVAALVMTFFSLPMQEVSDEAVKLSGVWSHLITAHAEGQLREFTTINDFKTYCINYTSANQEDTIVLNFSDSQADIEDTNFNGLGTEAYPFNGTVYVSQYGGAGYTFRLNAPFFNCVTDSVQVKQYIAVNNEPDPNADPIELTLVRIDQASTAPLFANKVVQEKGGAVWKVKSFWYQDTENPGVHDFGSIISEMDENASVSLDYDNSAYDGTSYAKTVATANAGMICGTMGTGSHITLTLKGTNTHNDVSVYSTFDVPVSAYAGGLVGVMESGSELEITSIDPTYEIAFNTNPRTITGTLSAGGLVGKCVDAKVTLPTNYVYKIPENSFIKGSETTGTDVAKTDQCAGGLFGYYETGSHSVSQFDLKDYEVNCKVSAYNTGGVFGALKTTGDFTVDGTDAVAVKVAKVNPDGETSAVGEFGGIAGYYCTTNLVNTVVVSNAKAETNAGTTSTYGGVFGWIDASTSACYLNVSDFEHTSKGGYGSATNKKFGGVVGSITGKNSLLNIGSVTLKLPENTGSDVNKFSGGGIVGNLGSGVLRLSGTTDLTAATATGAVNSGQLVGDRGDTTLVYAIGSGSNANWIFKRSADASAADDIGRWGSVVRIADIEGNSGALTYDSTNHTVTVAAPVTSMSSAMDFVKTALNMQLYSATSGDALIFSNTNVLSNNYTISGSISLTNTGIGGFMKDDSATDANIGSFTGNLSGTGSVTLAIGETYGDDIASPTESAEGQGQIYYHKYNGLFSRTGTAPQEDGNNEEPAQPVGDDPDGDVGDDPDGDAGDDPDGDAGDDPDGDAGDDTNSGAAEDPVEPASNSVIAKAVTISDVAIGGIINVNAAVKNVYVGGAVALVNDGITLSNTASSETINFKSKNNDDGGRYIGGLIGVVGSSNTKNIAIAGTSASSKVSLSTAITTSGTIKDAAVGGAIGYINSTSAFAINVSNVSLAATITSDATADNSKNRSVGGLIADIKVNSGSDTRDLNLTDLTVSGTSLTVTNAATSSGGILGYRWLNTDVVMDNVVLSGANTLDSNSASYAGLVYQATGHWTIDSADLKVNGLTANAKTPTNFAVIVLYGVQGSDGLYLELKASDSYELSANLGIPTSTGVYDELVGYTGAASGNSRDVQKNGSGVISYAIGETQSMSSSKCNTYQNKYNKTKLNGNSRYYYNISSMTGANDNEKLMLWSLYHYAAPNIQHCFYPENAFIKDGTADEISGTFDLNGYSYYPIDIDFANGVKLDGVNIQFYNKGIEAAEAVEVASGNTDESNRTTLSSSQHYRMHGGLFRNVSSSLSSTGDIHFKGSVCADGTYSGVLVSGTVTGSVVTSSSKEIVLEGIELNGTKNYLLINKVADSASDVNAKKTITICGVRTGGGKDFTNTATSGETAYTEGTYAKSLIGDVIGHNIQLTFSKMKLDSRTASGSTYADFDGIYGTKKSIFSQATLLNSFQVDTSSNGEYNYNLAEDWASASNHKGNVTYGKEITLSVEYRENNVSRENMYMDSDVTYTHPTADGGASEYTAFGTTAFHPYVYDSVVTNSAHTTYHEIKVNVKTPDILYGCGTYDHPYQISNAKELKTIAQILSGNNLTANMRIRLPKTPVSDESYTHWCGGEEDATTDPKGWNYTGCDLFTVQSGGTTLKDSSNNTSTWTRALIQDYFAGAYYKITADLTLESDFNGLGNVTVTSSDKTNIRYAFRGVIVGEKNDDGTPKYSITLSTKKNATSVSGNENTPGLIAISNGAVIKDLAIIVAPPSTDLYNYKASANGGTTNDYDYNDAFPNYGAVINKIMGGDNVIDNVTVTYNSAFKIESSNDYKATVGGYVGAVVNGGLVFRNIANDYTNFSAHRVNSSGEVQTVTVGTSTFTDLTDGGDTSHLYVNRFVGRVINGYAFLETTDDPNTDAKENGYRISENLKYGNGKDRSGVQQVTLRNSTKNYSIPDIDKDSSVLLGFSGSNYDTVKIPDSQSMYILSIITQMGAGCATTNTGDYQYSIAFDGTTGRYYSGDVNYSTKSTYKTTRWALYDKVGSTHDITYSDYAEKAGKDSIGSRTAIPYIIYQYTTNYGTALSPVYPARSLTGRTFYIELTGDGSYYLPDCFRGIGMIGSHSTEADALNDNMKIYSFDGNGQTIDLNSECHYFYGSADPYYGTQKVGNYYFVTGIALFNRLQQFNGNSSHPNYYSSSSDYQIRNFTLSGYISGETLTSDGVVYNKRTSSTVNSTRPNDDYDRNTLYTAGIVAGAFKNDGVYELYYNLESINFNSLEIRTSGSTGAITSRTMGGKFYINNCNADGLTLQGGCRLGGFIASADSVNAGSVKDCGIHINANYTDSSGNRSAKSLLTNITFNNTTPDTATDLQSGLSGGVVGTYYGNVIRTVHNNAASVIVRNVTVEGGEANSHIGSENNEGYSGGIIGYVNQVKGCLVLDCKVKEVSITGKLAGGVIGTVGKPAGSNASNVSIVNCSVEGKIQDNIPQYSITCTQAAGGLVGFFELHSTDTPKYNNVTYALNIDGCTVKDYKIEETGNADDSGAGGIIGVQQNYRNALRELTIANTVVNNCTLICNGSSNKIGMGGVIGYAKKYSNACIMKGYNLVIRNNTFDNNAFSSSNGNIAPYGNLVGRSAGSMKVQIVGYTVDNNKVKTAFGTNSTAHTHDRLVEFDTGRLWNKDKTNVMLSDYFNTTDSYIVYSDFNNTCFNMSAEDAAVSTLSEYSGKNYANQTIRGEVVNPAASPYATVSPKTAMGSTAFLTGDGAYLYVNGSTKESMAKVIASNTTPGKKYENVLATDKAAVLAAADPATTSSNKISTYQTEMGLPDSSVVDFPIVVINSTARADSTELITQYIRTLTNTTDDYAVVPNNTSGTIPSKDYRYRIKIYPCVYKNGNYKINESGTTAGLQSKADQLFMAKLENGTEIWADSNQDNYQFSLVDVQYFDPTIASTSSETKVVYHLYVPVLTRKMMKSNFKSAALQGTDVKAVSYDGKFGNLIAESLESWFTNYVVFQYPAAEINALLEAGDNLQWANDKAITLNYTTTNGDSNRKLQPATKILLVDPNKGDAAYYSTISQMRADSNAYFTENIDTLNFTNFYTNYGTISEDPLTKGGTGTRFSTSNYTTLAELAEGKLAAVTTGTKHHYKQLGAEDTPAEGATVFTINGIRYQYVEDTSEGTHNVVLNSEYTTLEEPYYISFSAATADMMYKFDINCPPVLSGSTRCQVVKGQIANAILGNVYLQTVRINVKNNQTTNELIDDENNILNIRLDTTVKLGGTEADKQFIVNNIAPSQNSTGIPLYQSFILYLSARDETGAIRKQIAGTPKVTGTITTPDASDQSIPIQYPNGSYIILPSYDLHSKITSSDCSIPISADIIIDYSVAAARNVEFPTRPLNYNKETYGNVGVNVSALSNLSYEDEEAKLVSSKMCDEPDSPDSKYFYVNELEKANLVYNATQKTDTFDKDGFDTNNRSQLGLNPRNAFDPQLSSIPIESVATYNASKVRNVDTAKYVRYTFKLEKKTGDADNASYVQVPFSDYFIGNINLSGMNMVTNETASLSTTSTDSDGKTLYYYAEIKTDENVEEGDSDTLANSTSKEFNVNVDFTVKTGGAFTDYANYRVRLIAELMTDNDDESTILAQSKGEDWIVYTNAKIDPSMITANQQTVTP